MAAVFAALARETIEVMDPLIAKLKTPEECAQFEKNVLERGRLDLAVAARKRGLQLRALQYGGSSEAELECLEAVYAYERALSAIKGKNTRAGRTWQMITRHGILGAVERAVNRPDETTGFKALLDMGLEDYAFEVVVLRHPHLFSAEAVQRSADRVKAWNQPA